MKTETFTLTVLTLAELHDLLRDPMRECGFDVDRLYFNVEAWEIIRVSSSFDLSVPCVGTLADLIEENPPRRDGEVSRQYLAEYLACLTDEALYGDKALPKTDYRVTDT